MLSMSEGTIEGEKLGDSLNDEDEDEDDYSLDNENEDIIRDTTNI